MPNSLVTRTSDRLKQHIRESSPVLAARRANVEVAIAKRQATGLRQPATLSGEIEEVPSFLNIAGAQSMRVDLSQQFLPPAQRRAERDVADIAVRRAEIELEITSRVLDATVDQLIAHTAAASVVASRLSSEDSLLRGAEEALRTRFAVGDARYVDVLRLRTERLRVETDIARSVADGRISRRQLMRLGAPADSTTVAALVAASVSETARTLLRGSFPALPSLDSLIASANALRLSALEVQQGEAARRLLVAAQRPSITPSLGLQRFTTDGGGSSLGITAGVSLPLRITARRGNEARIVVADREVAAARAEQVAAGVALAAEITEAADRYEAARGQAQAFDAALLTGAREEREAALASYRSGSLSLIELLDFERALSQAEVARIRSQSEAADALLDLLTSSLGANAIGARLPSHTAHTNREEGR